MADLAEVVSWGGVRQLEKTDAAEGGPGGVLNGPLASLVARTAWLRANALLTGEARTATVAHTFNVAGAAPFIIGAGSAGNLVGGLNAEFVGGKRAADLAVSDHTHALTSDRITGVLPLAKGGLGLSEVVKGGIVYAPAANTLGAVPTGLAGQLLTFGATGVPEWKTLDLSNYARRDQANAFTAANTFAGTLLFSVLGTGLHNTAEGNKFLSGATTWDLHSAAGLRLVSPAGDVMGGLRFDGGAFGLYSAAGLLALQVKAAALEAAMNLLPGTDNAVDLGSGTKRFRDVFVSRNVVFSDGSAQSTSAGLFRGCRLNRAGGVQLSGAPGTLFAVPWDTEWADTDNMVSLPGDPTRINITRTGWYDLQASLAVGYNNVNGAGEFYFRKNGTWRLNLTEPPNSGGYAQCSMQALGVYLYSGDYVQVMYRNNMVTDPTIVGDASLSFATVQFRGA